MSETAISKLTGLIGAELRQLMTVHSSERSWQMPLAAALSSGLPLLIGAYFDHLAYGLVSSLGGLVFLYLPGTPMYHRMVLVMACSFAMAACYAMGLMSQLFPLLMVPVLTFVSILVMMVCRFYALGPPGGLFFIMAASIGAFAPVGPAQLPLMVGLITLGSLSVCLVGFFYSLLILRVRAPAEVQPLPEPTFDFVVFDAVIIGIFLGISLAVAQALTLQKSYWVLVTCLAVMQAASLRAVWTRQLHRVIGTTVGLLLAWGLLLLPLGKWSIALTMMALTFIIEFLVVRHYALATVFITPLTILLAEAPSMGHVPAATLIQARFYDTLLGCLIGLIGGVCLHSPRFRSIVGTQMRRLIPSNTSS